MVILIHKVLYPMDLKRYMVLSFATLWTLVLITSLIVAIIHNVQYQDSSSQTNLEHEIKFLTEDLIEADKTIILQKEEIHSLKCLRPEISIEYYSCE